MPISFPSSPSSGQRYEFSFNAWTYNGTFWQSTGSSGQITSGAIGDNAIFSGNIASGSISAFNLASGVGGSSLVLTSGSITSGFIGNDAVTSGNIASGQVGRVQINDYNVGVLNNTRGGDYGYFAGGSTNIDVATADKLTYSTDTTVTQTTANLSQARDDLAGCSGNSIKGYFAGGYFISGTSTSDRITYLTDATSAQTSANLSQARGYLAGISEGFTKGYFAGGNNGSVKVATADKLTYSNDTTAAQTTANLSQARDDLAGCSGEGTKGYFAGGVSTGTSLSTVDKLTYSTDTTIAQTSANLNTVRRSCAGISEGLTKGYFAGGTSFSLTNTAAKLTYSTDTTSAQTSANLSQARNYLAGISEGFTKGYFAGGNNGSHLATADKLTYSNDTTVAQTTANLSQARSALAGVSQEYSSVFGNNCVFSGNISSSEIGSIHFGFSYPTSGSIKSGNIGDNAVNSGNIGSGQVGRFQISYFNVGTNLNLIRGGVKGYFAGGTDSSSIVATADKLTYSTDTNAAQTTANLSQAKSSMAGVSEKLTKGYFAGGVSTGSIIVATADKLTYSTDTTVAQVSANISQARDQLVGCSGDSTKGYFAGGNTGSRVTTADKITYSIDTTVAQTTANLSQARQNLAGISDGSTKGYFAGGYNSGGNAVTTADKLIFSNDTTAAQTTANLSQARYGLAGCNGNSTNGYFSGGTTNSSNLLSTADKLTYSTDTTIAQTTANLSQARFELAGISEGSTKGYFAGGTTGLVVTTADKLTYSTDTTIAQTTANLSQAKYRLTGLSQEFSFVFGNNSITSGNIASGQIEQFHFSSGVIRTATNPVTLAGGTKGFFAGGATSGSVTAVLTADKLTYSTDTNIAQTTANLSQARFDVAGCSGNSTKGYFAGGTTVFNDVSVTTANKLTYLTDTTVAQASANLSQARAYSAGCSGEGTKGYFAGGVSNGGLAVTADKLTYSTDTTIAQTTANLSQARWRLAGVSERLTKGYFAGGDSGLSVATAEKLTYSTDTTIAQTTANLSQLRDGLTGCSGDSTKGYFGGGNYVGFSSVAITDKLTYSTDTTAAQTSANLSQARQYLAGVSEGSTKGYFAGGYTSGQDFAITDKLTYTTDTTVAQTSANLSQARQRLGGVGQESLDYPTVNSGSFGNSSVNSGNIASGVVSQFHFSDSSIYSDSVRSGNVSTFKFANNAVFSGNISSSNTITTVNLASGGVQSGAFGDNAISSGDILSGRITRNNISSGALESFHIASGSISTVKLASGAAVGAFNLASGIVVSGNIASGSIFFTPFIDGAIESGNIASGAIGNIHLGNESVTSGAVPSGTVIFNMVGANATVAYNFADVALASGNFALQSVTGENLADGVWPIPTAFFVSGGITAFMFNNNSIVSGSISTTTTLISQGYFAGGSTGANVSTTDKILYSTDTTAAQTSANLSQSRIELAGISDYTTNGYFAGGATSSFSGHVATTDKIVYSTDTTAAQTTANLSQARQGLAGCSGEGTKGYFAGGTTDQANSLNTADKLTYSTGTTTAQSSANLSQARYYLAGISEGTTKGYFAGGKNGGDLATADKLTYSNDTTSAQTTADLSTAQSYISGCSGEGTKGYFAGGMNIGSIVATAYKITYTTDTTAAQTTANLSQARRDLAGISQGSTQGYFAGGATASFSAYVATADKITFSTDTTAAQTTANLSQATRYLAGIDGAQNYLIIPYLVTSGKLTTTAANEIRFTNLASGSVLSGNIVSGVVFSDATTNNFSNAGVRSGNIQSGEVGRVHFANETILSGNIGSGVIRFPEFFGDTTTYTNIASGQIGNVHLESIDVSLQTKMGYFAPVTFFGITGNKLNYSTDTTSSIIILNQARVALTGISEGLTKGYFAGGYSTGGTIVATTEKFSYSTETTITQATANLSQARYRLAGCSGESTKGYFAGGTTGGSDIATADKLTYSTDTTVAQASANLSQGRFYLAGISEGLTKGYFAGGVSIAIVATAEKLTYSTDTTTAQTTANLSQARSGVAGCSGEGTKGYFAGGDTGSVVTTADKITYSTDTTVAQTSANLSQARFSLSSVSQGSTKGYFTGGTLDFSITYKTADKLTYSTETTAAQTTADLSGANYDFAGIDGGVSYSQLIASSKISSGTIGLTTASGQNAAFPYNLSETAEINTNRPMFDYFVFQEQCSGIKAVCIASGSRVVRAQRASGMRLPAIGVTSGTVNSGAIGIVYYYGYVGRTGSFAANSGLNNGISGFQGRPLYVGSGGNIVNQSGFWVGGVQQPPFISGDMQQQIGIAMSGGLFVMPSPRVVRSGFRGTLPYNHPA